MAQLDGQIQDVQSSIRELETRARGLEEQKARLTAELNRLKVAMREPAKLKEKLATFESELCNLRKAPEGHAKRREPPLAVSRRNAKRLCASTVACWLLNSRLLHSRLLHPAALARSVRRRDAAHAKLKQTANAAFSTVQQAKELLLQLPDIQQALIEFAAREYALHAFTHARNRASTHAHARARQVRAAQGDRSALARRRRCGPGATGD